MFKNSKKNVDAKYWYKGIGNDASPLKECYADLSLRFDHAQNYDMSIVDKDGNISKIDLTDTLVEIKARNYQEVTSLTEALQSIGHHIDNRTPQVIEEKAKSDKISLTQLTLGIVLFSFSMGGAMLLVAFTLSLVGWQS